MGKQTYIAANWKMHMIRAEARALATELRTRLQGSAHRFLVAPPFTALETVAAALQGSSILVGAQNIAQERQGAHTGEISAAMLRDVGAQAVIIGHSERRHVYGETDALINAKTVLALEEGFEVILCVGETLAEREAGRVDEVNRRQLESGLASVPPERLTAVTIAYEPVWAIGTGKTATPDDADAAHRAIRSTLAALYNPQVAAAITIQYGGSVKPNNMAALMAQDNIDGALVGGASLQADSFAAIAHYDK